jgi:hypothetical protein
MPLVHKSRLGLVVGFLSGSRFPWLRMLRLTQARFRREAKAYSFSIAETNYNVGIGLTKSRLAAT